MVVGTSQPQKSVACKLPGLRRQKLQNIDSKLFPKIFPEKKKKWQDNYWKGDKRTVLRDLVVRRTIKSSVKVRNHKTLSVNELNNRGKFCHLLHLLSRGMDLFLQVQPVTWGGGKISSTHPYNALGYQPQQLVQWLNKAPGKLTDPAALWGPQREPQGQRTGGNGQQWLAEMPSLWQLDHLPCLFCQNRNTHTSNLCEYLQ